MLIANPFKLSAHDRRGSLYESCRPTKGTILVGWEAVGDGGTLGDIWQKRQNSLNLLRKMTWETVNEFGPLFAAQPDWSESANCLKMLKLW
jgi:hypothetical protein